MREYLIKNINSIPGYEYINFSTRFTYLTNRNNATALTKESLKDKMKLGYGGKGFKVVIK